MMDLIDIKIDGNVSDLSDEKIKNLNKLFKALRELGLTASVEEDGGKIHKSVKEIKKIKNKI